MIRKLFLVLLVCIPGKIILSQEITNIRFEQAGKMINVYYDLTGECSYEVKLYYSPDGGKNWGNPLINVSGDIGNSQEAGFGKKIIWDVLAEKESLQGEIKFKVEAVGSDFTEDAGIFTDHRDGKCYKWIKIGSQIWMAENLNYLSSSGSWCYDDLISNCNIYGRLYDWETAMTACPIGWHLPSSEEWESLTLYLGGKKVAGGKMKETGT